MKNLTGIVLICCCLQVSTVVKAQAPITLKDSVVSFHERLSILEDSLIQQVSNDSLAQGGLKRMRRDRFFLANRACNNVATGTDIFTPVGKALFSYMSDLNANNCHSPNQPNWIHLGPDLDNYGEETDEVQGRINSIWVDPTDTNIILAGADAGGLWKTNNAGRSWYNLTDAPYGSGKSTEVPGGIGVNQIAVNHLDNDIVYIALGIHSQYKKSGGYSMGLAYTTDTGQNWYIDEDFIAVTGETYPMVTKLAYLPGTQKLFAAVGDKFYIKESPTHNWVKISSSNDVEGNWISDFEFSKTTNDKVVVSTYSNTSFSKLAIYTISTGTWQVHQVDFSTGAFNQPNWSDGITYISVGADDTVYLNVKCLYVTPSPAEIRHVYCKTDITTFSLTTLHADFKQVPTNLEVSSLQPQIIYGQFNQGTALIVNRTEGVDPWGLGLSVFSSLDLSQPFGHVDGRCMVVYSSTNSTNGIDDVIYYGTDGGIRKKMAGTFNTISITGTGLGVTQFYGFGGTEANENYMNGGTQDNAQFAYIKTNTEPWINYSYGDAHISKFSRSANTVVIAQNNLGPTQAGTGKKRINGLVQAQFNGTTITDTDADYDNCPNEDVLISNINRPLYFDEHNNAFIGYSHLWQGNSSIPYDWQQALNNEPLTSSFNGEYRIMADFYINELNHDTAYIAYKEPLHVQGALTTDLEHGRLWRFEWDPFLNIFDRYNITPSICTASNINAIIADPQNNKRLWVAFGALMDGMESLTPAQMINKVWYSDDFGVNWQDVSTGLSAMPVNKLLYRPGSDDEIYAGTDMGVFKWNKQTEQWECFNNGMPPCIVMDMEFHHCSGKLRVATYGRGIWETDLPTLIAPGHEHITITTPTTWSSEKFITGNIRIQSGATLTITTTGANPQTTIHLPKDGRITVEPGAQLVIDNARLTNSCKDCWWQGIEVVGQSQLPQTTTNQGKVWIKNGSIIEHASKALTNWYEQGGNLNTCGGIIQAENSSFLNNFRSVSFEMYHGINTYNQPRNDVSWFKNCVFDINENYKDSADKAGGHRIFQFHASLWEVRGVQFLGNDFRNSHTGRHKGQGSGIYSGNAGYYVKPLCSTSPATINCGTDRNTFEGFFKAIYAAGTLGELAPIVIDRTDFDKNTIGIMVDQSNMVSAWRNNFTIGNGEGYYINQDLCQKNIGIYTTGAQVFSLEDNDFDGLTPIHANWENLGMVIENSGAENNIIYKNSFANLSKALWAKGANANEPGPFGANSDRGLRVLCNDFIENQKDVLITPKDGSLAGIATEQGSIKTDAGNDFNSSGVWDNYGHYNNYYYRNSMPLYYDPLKFYPFYINTSNNCSSRFASPEDFEEHYNLTEAAINSHHQLRSNAESELQDSIASLNSKIDGGDTEGLLDDVDAANPATPDILYEQLNGLGMWLSQEVLEAVRTDEKVTKSQFQQLLENNKDVLRNDGFLYSMGEAPYYFTEAEMDDLFSLAGTGTDRTALVSEISNLHTKISDVNQKISWHNRLSYFVGDNYGDSLEHSLSDNDNLLSRYRLVDFYLYNGQYTKGDSELETIPNNFDLNEAEANELEGYEKLWSILKTAKSAGRNVQTLTATELDSITAIAENSSYGIAKLKAQIVLDEVNIDPNPTISCFIESEMYRRVKPRRGGGLYANSQSTLTLSPNPADNELRIQYKFSLAADYKIVITNMGGQTVYVSNLDGLEGSKTVNVSRYVRGIYTYSLLKNGKVVESGKVVLK